MGNFNSSRWEGDQRRRTVEEATCALRVGDLPPPGRTALAAGTLRWPGPDGAVRAEVMFALATEADQRCTLALLYLAAGAGAVREDVALDRAPQPMGGARWWLRCPGCGRRRRTVYVAPGAAHFRCRVCAGLAYLTQQCEPIARLDVKLGRLARRLGDPDPEALPELPPKPPRLHWRTYDRLADVFGDARHARTARYPDGMTRLWDRYDPTWRGAA